MRLREIFLDYLLASKIFEMAEHRKSMLSKIDSKAWQIDSHLIKIFMYDGHSDVNHWCTEVTTWLQSVQRMVLKGSKKRLHSSDYRKILWESLLETVDEVQTHMEEISKEYPSHKIVNYDPAKIHKKLYEVLNDVCYDISHGKFSNIKDYL